MIKVQTFSNIKKCVKHFLGKLTVVDAVLDTVEDKDEIEVTWNKINNVPVLEFKDKEKVIDIIVVK